LQSFGNNKVNSIDLPQQENKAGITRSTFISKLALITGMLMMSSFLWGVRNKYEYRLRKQKIKLANLPKSFNGLKIIHISDIHCGSFDDKEAVERGVKMIMEQQPDLILFTGDLVNHVASEIVPYKDIFAQLKAPLGVFSVLGNHDYGDYIEWSSKEKIQANMHALKQHQADMGWRLLINENVKLEKN
jgi:predicted MPP superfamily phosphohydrolase